MWCDGGVGVCGVIVDKGVTTPSFVIIATITLCQLGCVMQLVSWLQGQTLSGSL